MLIQAKLREKPGFASAKGVVDLLCGLDFYRGEITRNQQTLIQVLLVYASSGKADEDFSGLTGEHNVTLKMFAELGQWRNSFTGATG